MDSNDPPPSPREARLNELIVEFLEAAERGDAPPAEEFLAQHAEFADSLRAFLRDQAQFRELANRIRPADTTASPADERVSVSDPFAATIAQRDDRGETTSSTVVVRYFGDYELLSEIARGGMGIVYKARQVSLNRIVAVKMVLSGEYASADELARFRREAEAAAQLDHPGIVPIYEVGEHDGHPYFSMGYVAGLSLAKRLANSPLAPRDAAELLREVALAVQYAHDRGVIHRDLKPGNILLANGQPRVTDFGLAKRVDGDRTLTETGQILGTPAYMPPEQAAGHLDSVGPASDVYALGAILYAMLTGRPPFQAASSIDTLRQVLEREPVSLHSLNSTIPRDLETLCLKCLEKSIPRRYPSAQAVADELQRYLEGRPLLARPVSRTERMWRWCLRNPTVAALVSFAALLTVALVVTAQVNSIRLTAKNIEIQSNLDRALTAESKTREQLRESSVAHARLMRTSGRPGQRIESLRLLKQAAEIRWDDNLRDEAIAALGLTDLVEEERLPIFTSDCIGVAFDHRGEVFARAGWQGDITLHRRRDREPIGRLVRAPSPTDQATLSFSPDDRLLAVHWDGWRQGATQPFTVWEMTKREVLWTLPYLGIDRQVAFAFSPDSRFVALGFHDKRVRVYESANGQEVASWQTAGVPRCFDFRPDSQRIAVGTLNPATVEVHELPSRAKVVQWQPNNVRPKPQDDSAIMEMGWHPDGRSLAIADYDGVISLLNAESGQIERFKEAHQKYVSHVAFHPTGRAIFVTTADGITQVWDAASLNMLVEVPGIPAENDFVRSGGDELLLREATKPDVQRWSTRWSSERLFLDKPREDTGIHGSAVFSDDGRWLLTNHRDGLRVWNLPTCRLVESLPIGMCQVLRSVGNEFVTVNASAVQTWKLTATGDDKIEITAVGEPLLKEEFLRGDRVELDGHFSQDGRRFVLATGAKNGLLFVDRDKNQQRRRGESFRVTESPRFSRDGRWIAAIEYNARVQQSRTLHVWDADSGDEVFSTSRRKMSFAFHSDSQQLLVTDIDGCQALTVGTWQESSNSSALSSLVAQNRGRLRFAESANVVAIYTRELVRLATTTGQPFGKFSRAGDEILTHCEISPNADWLYLSTSGSTPELWNLRALRESLARHSLAGDWPTLIDNKPP